MPAECRPNLAAVAAHAGVAVATASYALRGHPKISPATRHRVLRAARALSYVPDPELGRLMHLLRIGRPIGPRSPLALLSLDEPSESGRNYYIRALADSVRQRCAELGYGLERIAAPPAAGRRDRLSRLLRNRGIRGLIIPPLRSSVDCSELVDWSEFAVVAATHTARRLSVNRVVPHHLENAFLALSRLESTGCRRIGLVTEAGDHERVSYAYLAALALHQQEGASRAVPTLEFDEPGSFVRWHRSHRPDAILATEQRLGAALSELIRRERLRGTPIVLLNRPLHGQFEGVYPHPEIVGKIAVDLLAAQLQRGERGGSDHPTVTLVEGSWMGRSGESYCKRQPKVAAVTAA